MTKFEVGVSWLVWVVSSGLEENWQIPDRCMAQFINKIRWCGMCPFGIGRRGYISWKMEATMEALIWKISDVQECVCDTRMICCTIVETGL